jgi:hypothetical protein
VPDHLKHIVEIDTKESVWISQLKEALDPVDDTVASTTQNVTAKDGEDVSPWPAKESWSGQLAAWTYVSQSPPYTSDIILRATASSEGLSLDVNSPASSSLVVNIAGEKREVVICEHGQGKVLAQPGDILFECAYITSYRPSWVLEAEEVLVASPSRR